MALKIAARQNVAPGKVLMPLAFGSILGGMTTLIGTPPNMIVSGFRAEVGLGSFSMFDFTPVGLVVAGVGVGFVVLAGRWLVPNRQRSGTDSFETGSYLTEARVPEKAKAAGMTLREIEAALDKADAQVVGLIRQDYRLPAPNPARKIRVGDILIIEAEPEALASVLSSLDHKLEGEVHEQKNGDGDDARGTDGNKENERKKAIQSDEITLSEVAVLPNSVLIGRSASDLNLRTRFGINLLAVSRQGHRSMKRLRTMTLLAGDVLLMQGAPETLSDFSNEFGCVPLAQRSVRLPDKRLAVIATAILSIAIAGTAFGLMSAAVAFSAGVLAAMAFRVMPLRRVYDAIDWPVIVLLGALIPVAGAMATTGAADLLARLLLEWLAQGNAIFGLVVVLIVTMTLSDFMNNAATAAVMCPVAISTAHQLGASADPFLMAVAVGASCAFLTPIGHQNNTLILGPGGFHFGDYWRLGLPLEIIVVVTGVPMILLVWPL